MVSLRISRESGIISITVEITSKFIEDTAIGQLHVVRFRPEQPSSPLSAIVPNSLAGNVFTPDGFGIPYSLAHAGIDTLYVEFPGSGHSSMPEDKELRNDYKKRGITVLGDPVQETLTASAEVLDFSFDNLILGGFSMGAIRAATLLPGFKEKVVEFFGSDSAGYGAHPTLRNLRRYRRHIAACEKEMAVLGESVEDFYADIKPQYNLFAKENEERLKRHKAGYVVGALELRSIYDSMTGLITQNSSKRMREAVENGQCFTLRSGFVGNAYALDYETVTQTNAVFGEVLRDAVEADAPVAAGFVQGGWFGEWHDQAVSPKRILRLISEPLVAMETRLHHIYMP